ncbi:hypothetical protein CYMTET_26263 [Cymbomonas tetramitiformis]|uniref:Uncharacterized protein n=1 Tax=Cymbomonas tetramitiformis TaxID=36881 RepID=A0AAE0FSW4_9CHLO|nr:hypothetical protein CYMTET_26263 [Cymbomonas tetramitiformis]
MADGDILSWSLREDNLHVCTKRLSDVHNGPIHVVSYFENSDSQHAFLATGGADGTLKLHTPFMKSVTVTIQWGAVVDRVVHVKGAETSEKTKSMKLIRALDFNFGQQTLLVGCGYGVVIELDLSNPWESLPKAELRANGEGLVISSCGPTNVASAWVDQDLSMRSSWNDQDPMLTSIRAYSGNSSQATLTSSLVDIPGSRVGWPENIDQSACGQQTSEKSIVSYLKTPTNIMTDSLHHEIHHQEIHVVYIWKVICFTFGFVIVVTIIALGVFKLDGMPHQW